MTNIYDLLYHLGVTANYTGFFHTAYAVSLCAKQPDRLLMVTKWLYPAVAKQYRTNWKAVERNIRTVGGIIWRENRPLLEHLARRPLTQNLTLHSCWLSWLLHSIPDLWRFMDWVRR